jgi:hypothetical protein
MATIPHKSPPKPLRTRRRTKPRQALWPSEKNRLSDSTGPKTQQNRCFPELAAAAAEQLPSGVVPDGEAVIWSQGRLDFDALQARMTTPKAQLASLVRGLPGSFAAFDLLAVAGRDIRGVPLSGRRELLEALAMDLRPALNLSPAPMDRELAKCLPGRPAAVAKV